MQKTASIFGARVNPYMMGVPTSSSPGPRGRVAGGRLDAISMHLYLRLALRGVSRVLLASLDIAQWPPCYPPGAPRCFFRRRIRSGTPAERLGGRGCGGPLAPGLAASGPRARGRACFVDFELFGRPGIPARLDAPKPWGLDRKAAHRPPSRAGQELQRLPSRLGFPLRDRLASKCRQMPACDEGLCRSQAANPAQRDRLIRGGLVVATPRFRGLPRFNSFQISSSTNETRKIQ